MDKFFRVDKPGPHQQRQHPSKPPLPRETQPKSKPASPKTPRLNEWADVISERARETHVEHLSDTDVEHVLRLFDLNPAFGPFVGIDREFRWARAERCGLQPPLIVKRIIDSGRAARQREAGQLW